MLTDLRIKNFVIIEELAIGFGKGLNVLTGETGAGKSILIDALSGILGDRMTTDMIRSGFEKATLEGVFDISSLQNLKLYLDDMGIDHDDDVLVMRRELFSNGKGRSFSNGIQIPASRLKEIAEYLVDIHGQNEHQSIMRDATHRELLDGFSGNDGIVAEIKALHTKLQDIKARLESFDIDEREKARRIEFNTFAIKEINGAGLSIGEDEDLKNDELLLENAEKLFREINSASELISGDGGVVQKLRMAEQCLSKVSEFDIKISSVMDSMKDALYAIEDTAAFLRDYEKNIDYSPERINQVEERLAIIASLKKKYGDSIDDILMFADKAQKEIDAISSSEEKRERLGEEYRSALLKAKDAAFTLSHRRMESALKLEGLVMNELKDLGMAGTVFRVSVRQEMSSEGIIESENKKYMLYPHGIDHVEFLIATGAKEELRPLKKVASGGEMSRIMLALKNVICATDIVDTLIFDEVDAGIGGMVADMVGRKLKSLSRDRQVLVITHLPQIAAMSDVHYQVQKGSSGERITTHIRRLGRPEKIKEVARMLAGEKVTDISLKHAEELVRASEQP